MQHAQEKIYSQGEDYMEEGGADNAEVGRQRRRI